VPGQIAGLNLSSVESTSDTSLDDLTQVAQERVKQGIQADDLPDAERRLAELTNDVPGNPNLKPACLQPTPTASPSPGALPGATATSSATSGTPSTGPTGATTGAATSAPPASAPATTPDAPPAHPVPPVIDPADCRPSD
jgi:hypothetical protein